MTADDRKAQGLDGAGSRGLSRRVAEVGARLLRTRPLVRAPIFLFKARLGFLFGGRLLMLEHRGRRSGLWRRVVLEIVDRPDPSTCVVVSGFGRRAQWYRNVEADPEVRVWLGSARPAPATARALGTEEAAAALRRYAVAHPRSWSSLRPVLERTLGTPITNEGTELPMVALRVKKA